ncbi:hypothetical protein PQX77_014879 [Marasmius sp. AFHP31]|nr:hypothetical protein PQX77_014879 [Marasmius sp. AFHP31]
MSLFTDSPEYQKRKNTPFSPTKLTLAQVRATVPRELHTKSTAKSLYYVVRSVFFAAAAYRLAWKIDIFVDFALQRYQLPSDVSIFLAGWWCLAHEAGHGALSSYSAVNNLIGFALHTFLLVPYYAWRSTHHAHHKATASVERDEHWVPRERGRIGLPSRMEAKASDYQEIFDEAPIFTLGRLVLMQTLGWQTYLTTNVQGSPRYPNGIRTNHFFPSSPLFKQRERKGIIASNIGIAIMVTILCRWTYAVGWGAFVKLYFIPYLLTNHWIVMLTYLHHTDPTIPYYRKNEWNFLRGALATVDRPLLGWAGRFFLHNVSHDHIAHHLFSSTPFYNQPQITAHLKKVLGDDYNYDSTNTFRALYRSFTECCFIEDDSDIVFYANKHGMARAVAPTRSQD